MTRLGKAMRDRRDSARTRREVSRAIDGAATRGMREELMTMAQHQGLRLR